MDVERDLLISILKLTKSGQAQQELVAGDAKVPTQVVDRVLEELHEAELIRWQDKTIDVSSNQRVKIAIYAIKSGADFERVCRVLEWIEFENLAAVALQAGNFNVKRRFRFKWAQRRWEIDVLGYREPLIICLECKRWSHGWRRAVIKKAVRVQIFRAKMLAEALPSLQAELGLVRWRQSTIIPAVLSLIPGPMKFSDKVPIVPILQLQSFLDELPVHVTSVMHFRVHF